MSRFDDIQRDYLEAVNQVRSSFGMAPTDNASEGAWEVMANHSPESFNSYSDNSAQSTAQPEGYQQTQNLGISDPFASSANSEKWYAGDRPTYAESVARLYTMQGMLPPEQFNALTAELDKMKHDLSSGFYQNWYETITSPYVDAIAKLGVDVSGGINDEWLAKNQYLLQGARYTDAGTTPAAPTKNSTAAQNAAYYYYQIQRNYADTKEVLNEEAALKDEIAYWVSRDDLNLSDQQILDQLDWKGKYKYLQGLKDAQGTGKQYNYTQPIDYNPDNLRGYIWAARNGGGSGNDELDAINAALGRGNVWKETPESKANSAKLEFGTPEYEPYEVKCTNDAAAQYFGVKEFPAGWAEDAKSKIDVNNPDDVKYWKQVYKAEKFTSDAEKEIVEAKKRIDLLIDGGQTDPKEIKDFAFDKWSDKEPALSTLQALDDSLQLPDSLIATNRPLDFNIDSYIDQKLQQKGSGESLPEFGARVTDMLGTNIVHGNEQASAPIDVSAAVTPTATPGVNPTVPAPRETPRPVPEPTPTPTPMFGQTASVTEPTPMPVPAPRETPRPVPIVDQSARAVNKAQTQSVLDAAKTILTTGTPDEKQVLNLAPTVNAESVAAEMANSVQNGKADAGSLYESTAKQAQEFTATHYVTAKMATQFYEDLQAKLANLQAQQAEIQKQYDQVQYQVDRGIVPGVASKEVQIDGETHVLTADYDPTSREYIINDSNPTSSAEVERQKEEYANTLRYGLNMEETYAEKDNQLLVAAEALNMQLTAINQQVANAQKAVDDYKMRYDQAQGELRTSQSMINAAAMLSARKANPDMDFSTPEGQKALAEARDQQNALTKSIDLLMGVSNTYVPTEWAATTVLDNMEANGFDSEQTGLAARGIIGEANKDLAALDQAEAEVQAAGVSIPGDSNNIKRAREQAQQKKQEAEDFLLRRNEDFDQVVSDMKESIQSDVDGKKYGALARYAVDPNLDQPTTTLADNLGTLAQAGNLNSYDAVQPHRQSYMDSLTQEERDTYLYKLAKEGEQAAWDYYNRLGKYVDVRQTQAQNKELAAFAKDMPVLAAITSIGISPDTIKGAGYVAASLISGREINPYSKFFDTTRATSTLDQNAKEKILEPLEEGSIAKKIAGIGYDAITSGAKSLLNTAMTAPLTGGSAFLGAVPMGIQAAGAAAQEAKLQGGSDTQAALMAGVTFAAETLSETITTQNIAKAIDSGAKGVKGAMKKVLANDLVEEFFGESATQLVEGLTDDAIMGELSQRNQKIKDYEQTMSHEEAVKQADKDFWTDVLAAGVTGALSAAGTSGISYAAGRLTAAPNTTQPSAEGQARATALANSLPLDRATQTPRQIEYAQEPTLRNNLASIETAKENGYRINHDSLFETLRGNVESMLGQAGIDAGSDQGQNIIQHFHDKWVESLTSDEWEGDINGLLNILKEDIDAAVGQEAPAETQHAPQAQTQQQADYAQEPTLRNNLTNIQTAASNGVVFTRDAVFATLQQNVESMLDQAGIDKNSETGQNIISRFHDQWMASLDQGGDVGSLVDALKSDLDAAKSTKASVKHGAESMEITPADAKDDQVTARTLTLLTSSLNAGKGSQVQALSAALFPVSGDAQSQRAAVSAGLHLANQMGTEQAVAVAQDVILAAEQEGADQQAVKDALRTAALGGGESARVLKEIAETGITGGDVQALIEAAGRDAQNPAIAKRMQAVIHNDRVASRTRDLIGQGALNGVKPYEQAYSQAKAQEAQTQQNLAAEQERAQTMGENLKTVQAQHAENPSNTALAGAMKQAVKDVAGQVKVVGEYQQSLENQQQKTRDAEKDLNRVRKEAMTKVREQAMADVQAEEQAEAQAAAEAQAVAEAAALAEAEAQAQAEQSTTSNPNAGTVYTNDQVPVSYHWALVPASDLVTSNTDTGEANSAYPAELQPRDRTRAASQDQVAGMVRNLNPARLGESADAQNGAPIVGPDNVVESGNARTMAIRQAMASNPESAARYTQYVRDNAARFGLNPDDVTGNSVLVRVRDTDLDRVAFARAANESTTATYSPSENAQGDADRLTPRMMELFAPSDTGRLDTTENHAFALAFLNEIIPESERGAYMQDDGSISQQGYDRIRNAVFQRAYGSTALTQALTEDTDGSARNVMNALLKAAPRMMALQDAVNQGGVYDTGLPQAIAAAAERYMQLKNAGMSVEAYLGQTAMPGIQTEDEATQSLMRLFDEYRRSGKKLSEALTNIADAVEDAGDPRAVSFLGQTEAPPLTELIRQGVERMLRPKDNTVMNEKADDGVPTLVGELPPDVEGNGSAENPPERETYTLDLSAGAPPSGNGPATTAETPLANGPQRQFGSQTAQNSDLLHEEVKRYLRENSSYDPDSNNEQLDRAAGWVQEHSNDQDPDGYYGAVAEAQGADFNAFSADGQARMLTLMSMAALRGDVATETALADAYNQQGTVLGRALQARQIFGMMTPLGRQSVLIKETNKINQRYAEKGQTTRVALSPDTLEAAGKAKTAEDFQRVQKQAYKELAEQMPPNWKDKLQAWRMLSMLGNPRTHVRNMLGNAIFMPAVKLKNVIGTALESAFVKPGSGEMRTKSLTVSKENRAFAKADAVKMKDTMTGEAKYNADRKVDQERKIFGTKDNFISRTFGKALQHVSDFNSWALEAEDWVFLRRHYENALGGWMQANKLTPDTITPEQLTQAREYAINEAQKATYRDASKVANWLSESSRKGGAIGWVVEAVLPFKKTPANILKRGIEYSPVGLMRAVTQDLANVKKYNDWVSNGSKGAMPKNALSPTQYIDRLSSGLSGTAITALGYMLASMGAVTVGLDDDKGELEELAGKQEYALNIRLGDIDVSYTVDWAAPVSLPFFVGASLFNATQGEIQNVEQVVDALLSITEPVFNLSMLDGVNSLLQTSQWSSGNAMTQIGEKLATNYLSSFIPTALGQVSRTIDPVRRKSYVESGAPMSTVRYAFEQAQNKTPFSVSNIPYRNVWGEEDRSPEWLAAIENFISPGYINKITPGKVEKELASLYDETGDKKAVPQAASKSPYINGQQVKLNAEQYDQYTKVRGTTAKNLLEELTNRPEWALLDGNAKIDIVGEAWTYSNAVAAKDLFPDAKITAWIQIAQHEGNAAETIMNRHEEKAKKEYVDGYKTSLFEAVDEHDTEAFNTSMFALLDADKKEKEAQGKKQNPAYVNNLLVNHYKPLYITAINSGDAETVETIRDNLLSMPMAGIDAKTILSWQYEAQKQKVK